VAAEIKRITARGCAVPGRMMVVCPSALAEHQDTFQVSACWHDGVKHHVTG
jgi:hypothetical protein